MDENILNILVRVSKIEECMTNIRREVDEIKTNHIEHLNNRIQVIETLMYEYRKESSNEISGLKQEISDLKIKFAYYIGASAVIIVFAQYVLEHVIK